MKYKFLFVGHGYIKRETKKTIDLLYCHRTANVMWCTFKMFNDVNQKLCIIYSGGRSELWDGHGILVLYEYQIPRFFSKGRFWWEKVWGRPFKSFRRVSGIAHTKVQLCLHILSVFIARLLSEYDLTSRMHTNNNNNQQHAFGEAYVRFVCFL